MLKGRQRLRAAQGFCVSLQLRLFVGPCSRLLGAPLGGAPRSEQEQQQEHRAHRAPRRRAPGWLFVRVLFVSNVKVLLVSEFRLGGSGGGGVGRSRLIESTQTGGVRGGGAAARGERRRQDFCNDQRRPASWLCYTTQHACAHAHTHTPNRLIQSKKKQRPLSHARRAAGGAHGQPQRRLPERVAAALGRRHVESHAGCDKRARQRQGVADGAR